MGRKRGLATRAVGIAIVLVGPSVVGRGVPAAALPSEGGSAAGDGTWVTHGPTTPQVVTDLVVDPSDPDTLYAATSSTAKPAPWGVLKTTDGAATWGRACETSGGGCFTDVISLAIDPSDPDTVYAGAATGVWKTIDGGETWTGIGGPAWAYVAADPSRPGTAYAASETGGVGVWKTTDGGENWTGASEGLSLAFGLRSLVVDPFDPDTVYVGTPGGSGVFRSTDGAETWTPADDGLTGGGSTRLLADPFRPGRLYAGNQAGLFRTIDGGARWLRLDIGSNGLPSGGYEPLAADASSPDTIYVRGTGLYRTTNGGLTWSALPADAQTLEARGNIMYSGGYGVYRSADGGATWQLAIEGFPILSSVYSLAIDPSDPRRIYAGLDNNYADGANVWLSEDAGLTWRIVGGLGLPDSPWVDGLAVPPSRPGTVYLATRIYQLVRTDQQEKMGVYKSTDYGATWIRVGPPIDLVDDTFFAHGAPAYSLAIDPVNPDTVYVGGRGVVFKTTDGGATWLKLPAGISEWDAVFALAVDPSDPAAVYAGTWDAAVYKSVTGGLGWVPATAGMPSRTVTALAIDPAETDTVYAATCPASIPLGNVSIPTGLPGLYKSTDGGLTWSRTALTSCVYSVAVDPSDTERLFAGAPGGGILVSEDGGATWAEMNEGFPCSAARALAIDPTGTRLYAAAEFGQLGCGTGGVYILEREVP